MILTVWRHHYPFYFVASDKFYMVFKFLNEAVNFKNETFEGKVVCLSAKFFWAWYYLFQSLTEPDTSFINLIWFSILEDSKAHRPVSIWDHQLHLMDQLSITWHSYYYLQECWWAFSDPLLTLLQEQHPLKSLNSFSHLTIPIKNSATFQSIAFSFSVPSLSTTLPNSLKSAVLVSSFRAALE